MAARKTAARKKGRSRAHRAAGKNASNRSKDLRTKAEHRRAEVILLESEDHLRFALETSHTGAWDLDLVDHTAHRSLEHDRIFGYAELLPEWTYEMFLDHVLPEDRAAVDAKFRHATATQSDWSFECRIRRVDGVVRWIWAAGRHRLDAAGGPRRMAGIVQDITERKRAEEALQESQKDFSRAQAVGSIGSWRLDTRKNILTWSDENHRIFGIPEGTPMTYETFLSTVHPDDRQYVDTKWKAGLAGEDYDIEHRIVVGAQIKWVREKAYLEFDNDGVLLGGFGITQDITERKHAAEQLEMVAKFPSENPSPVLRIVSDGTILYSNGPGLSVLDEWGRQVGQEAPQDWCQQVARALDSGRNIVKEVTCGRRIVSFVAAPVVEGGYVNLYGRDITKERRAVGALRNAHAELEKKVQQRTDQLARTVMDLRHEVEHRTRAEEAVKAERQRFNDVLETLPAYVCLLTPDYYMPFANRVFREWFGYRPDKKCYEFLFNRTTPCDTCETYTVLKTDKPHRWEWTGPNGRNYDIFDFPFKDTDGSQLILEMGIDITERKQAEAKVQAERKRLYDVLETLPVMICLLTTDYHVAFANRPFREHFGESGGRHCYQYCFGRTEPCEFCETYTVLKTGHPHHWEVTGPDGSTIEVYDFPFTDVDGSPLILEMDIDITEQKRAQEALRSSALYTRGLIEASLDPLVTISQDGRITDVNKATELVTGMSRQQLIGADFSNYFTEPDKARKGYQKVFSEGFITDYPLTIRRGDGGLTDVIYNAAVYRNESGEIQGVFAAARDITEKKITERELEKYRLHLEDLVKQRTEELGRSNRDLEQFAYAASHDLQEPLRAIAGFVELLKQNLQSSLDGKTSQYMDFTVDGVLRMQSLISGLLEYSRVGTHGSEPKRMDAGAALDQAIANLRTSIEESGADIASDDLPMVHFDGVQLSQLFQNLIGNAIKFRAERPPRIHISAARLDNCWRFAVADNGIGIDPQYAERIFLIFQRLHSREEYPGTGIGLAICKKIVERHNGKIWVESKPGSGSTFYFTVPEKGETN